MSDLPRGWVWADLADVCTSITDGDHQAPPQVLTGIPFLVIGNIRNHQLDFTHCRHVPPEYFQALQPTRRPQRGDVLYSLVGSYGIPVLIKDDTPFCVQRHIGILRPSPEISSAFLALSMRSRAVFDQATQYATGTAQLTVPLSGLRRIRLPLPPRPEQERIVAAIEEQFSRLDAGIALLERVRQSIERMRGASFSQLYTEALSASSERQMKEVSEFIVDGEHNPPQRVGKGVPYLTSKHIKHGFISTEGASFITEVDFASLRRRYDPRKGDVLVTCVGTLGEVAVVPDGLSFAADRNIAAIRPSAEVLPSFLEASLRSPRLQKVLTAGSGSTAQPHLYLRDLRQLQVPVPALDIQELLISSLRERLAFADRLETDVKGALERSERLRSSILAAAFSGRLVPQDPADEPASALVERITAERASSNGQSPARTWKRGTPREKVV
jgi:restriction endonuclease S subunit